MGAPPADLPVLGRDGGEQVLLVGEVPVRRATGHGYHVLAGVRREGDAEALRAPGLEPVPLDVTDPGQIEAVVRRIAADPAGRPLRAVINNAGIAITAPVELLPMDEWRRQFDVNFFGHVAVTKAVLPALHASSGRVVNIGSVGGKVAMPTYGTYAGAKFAMEAMSDALRRALAPHGVQVVVVEPGGVRTEMTGHGIERANDTIGRDAAVLTRLSRLLPDRVLDRVMAAGLRPHFPR